nr:hypothetical protein Iba_chr12aCG8040 [Ipomoea batatas]
MMISIIFLLLPGHCRQKPIQTLIQIKLSSSSQSPTPGRNQGRNKYNIGVSGMSSQIVSSSLNMTIYVYEGERGKGSSPQHIHSINMYIGHTKGRTLLPNFRVRSSPQVGHTNGPKIVLNNKHNRQFPQCSHVQALIELAIIASPIPEKCKRHVITIFLVNLPPILRRECSTSSHWNALTNESKTTKHIAL